MNSHEEPKFKSLLSYGLLGLALGSIAVPIYIQVPFLYNREYGVPSSWIAIILLLSRLIDAVLDPLIGLWVDKRASLGNRYRLPMLLACPLLVVGMLGVYFPVGSQPIDFAASLSISLLLVHLGFSLSSIAYQSWGAELGRSDSENSMFVASREGLTIIGVALAASLSVDRFAGAIFVAFAFFLSIGMLALLKLAPLPWSAIHAGATRSGAEPVKHHGLRFSEILEPLRHANFRSLMLVFFFNGLAAALPATLVPYYLQDRLGLADDQWVLGVYFLVGAASTIAWTRLAARIGLVKSWLLGMVITVPAFVLVVTLQRGDLYGYLLVCITTGIALGADLSLPAAIVARLIHDNGVKGQSEGTYFGLWNWMNKLNLALAPTLALYVLEAFSYRPELNTPSGLGMLHDVGSNPLLWVYALVPCALKLIAVVTLSQSPLFKQPNLAKTKLEINKEMP